MKVSQLLVGSDFSPRRNSKVRKGLKFLAIVLLEKKHRAAAFLFHVMPANFRSTNV